MLRITAVEKAKKTGYHLFVEGEYALTVSAEVLAQTGLRAGQEISPERLDQIKELSDRRRARERALYLLERCGRTEREIAQKLQEGMYPPEVIRDTLEGLKRLGLLDDEQYGRQYIDAYREKRSRKRLCRDLQQKGLSPELIRRLLEEEPVDEDRQIRTFLQKKGYDRETWTRQEKGKLAAALARKGFSWEAVYRMLGGDGEDGDF